MTELETVYQQVVTKTKYARWRGELGRRETWGESVDRTIEFYSDHCEGRGTPLPEGVKETLHDGILNLHVSPSMRAMMTAGEALERDNVAAYNCAFLAINRIKAFSEVLYILCCGTGVGFSVEQEDVNRLPIVPDEFYDTPTTIVVPDSKIGWATSFHELLSLLWAGKVPQIDTSLVRPAGAPLRTFGGRASGPEPLLSLFNHTIDILTKAAGRRLSSKECHSIVCKIGDIVVVGGVRRSALISLSDPDDIEMRDAKSGEWWNDNPHFRLANNTAVWSDTPDPSTFQIEWDALVASGSGERGEIILRDRQFCNLTEVTVRSSDDFDTLAEKVVLATILGMIQSTFTDFRYLSKRWKENCDEERLLGVSFTGMMDHPVLSGQAGFSLMGVWLDDLRALSWTTASEWAKILKIKIPAAITTGKPSGNNSQRLNTASGAHARWSPRYVRRMRMSKNDPVAQLLYVMGVPCEDEIFSPDTTWVFSFPQKAPESALTRHDITALYQLEHWLTVSRHWCDHNQSITINVREDEWEDVGKFVYDHFDEMLGVSFLPGDDHVYQQAPYEDIDEEEYQRLLAEIPENIDWSLLSVYENSDQTEGAKELACVAGQCEL
jgi:ribonucleoside-triphosphate reductase